MIIFPTPGRGWRHRVDGTDGGAGEDAAAYDDATRTQRESHDGWRKAIKKRWKSMEKPWFNLV